MAEAPKSKQEIWKEAHAQRTQCPACGKCVTLRTLRWRHLCGNRSLPQRLLDANMAALRRQELEELALATFEVRAKERNGGPPGGVCGADQGAVAGA